jgi:transcriptional regulator with XRE-family HTH domain
MTLGEYIKGLRKEQRLTQKDFASELGIGQAYLSQIEKGHKMPSQELIADIAWYFKIPLGVFFLNTVTEDKIHPDSISDYRQIMPEVKKMLSEIRFA